MLSRTKIKSRIARKTNPELIETLREALKHKEWIEVAKLLSSSRSKYSSINLSKLEEATTEGDTIVVIGKVLGSGNLNKRIRVCALGYSKEAKEKLKKIKAEIVTIKEEIKANPKAEGIKIIK